MLKVPGYTTSEILYDGQATIVCRALRDTDRLQVVIKSQSSALPTARDIARMRHEYEVLSALQGPGVPVVHGLESAGHRLALVMEDLGFPSLDRLLVDRLDLALILRIVAAAARVLRRAHERRVVHKDIKPHNLLVRVDPLSVYVIDWGSAALLSERRWVEIDPAATEATLAYMAPEQTGLLDRPIDARTDLYLLGATFYQLLTGVLPFTDEDPRALVHSHLTRIPRPPHQVDPRIPTQISEIAMRLLAKGPEDRYASARGLELDLVECLEQWESRGEIVSFPLGRLDRSGELVIPEKLYGREADLPVAMAAFSRAQHGSRELLLVTGGGGIGKSALVRELYTAMRLEGARFAQAKFEQFQGATPYASLAQVFRQLLRQIMSERVDSLEHWKAQLQAVLGGGAGAWTAMLPELERVLGPQPPAPHLDPIQAEGRFHLFVQQLVSIFSRPERPLVLFLDDLQWAEPASLKILERLLLNPESGHLLVIGAYRDHDPGAIELLTRALDSIAAAGAAMTRLALGPLEPPEVSRLVADALGKAPAQVEALGAEIHRKTRGNPFFVRQLLTSLAQEALISLDEERGEWAWDLAAITIKAVTDNAAEFMVERLRQLDASAQTLLSFAACLGGEFEHDMLAELAGLPTAACARGLWGALVEGFVVPLHEDYRLLRDSADAPGTRAGAGSASSELSARVSYRFLHDRVQEAAYLLLDEKQQADVHLRIARLLIAKRRPEANDPTLFTIVEHLRVSQALLVDPAERLAAASFCLDAGRRAIESIAYDAARAYLSQGMDHLPEGARESAYALDIELRTAYAQVLYLCGDFAEADALCDALCQAVRTEMERLEMQFMRLKLGLGTGRYPEQVRMGRHILSSLSAPLPDTDEDCKRASDAALDAISTELCRRTLEEVVDMAPMTDLRARMALRTLVCIDAPAFVVSPPLSALISLRQVLMSLEHGPSELSFLGFMTYAIVTLRTRGRTEAAERAIQIGWRLYERYPALEYTVKAAWFRFIIATSIDSFSTMISRCEEMIEANLRYGNTPLAGFGCHFSVAMRYVAEEDLDSLYARLGPLEKLLRRGKYERELRVFALVRQLIASLKGRTRHPTSLSDEQFDEEAFLAAETNDIVLGYYYSLKATLMCLYGEEAALSLMAEEAKRWRQISIVLHVQTCFQVCLLLCTALETASGEDAERYQAMLDEYHALVTQRRALHEENWRCHDLLIQAERARLGGLFEKAQRLYDEVMTLAEQDGLPRLYATASELCGRHHAKLQNTRIACLYMKSAKQGWLRWGATAKAEALASEFPELAASGAGVSQRPATTTTTTTTTTMRHTSTIALQGVLYDLGQAMEAAYAISSELAVDGVLDQFLRASCTAAAAKRAFVVLATGGDLTIAGRLTTEPLVVNTALRDALTGTAELSEAIARYVARSLEQVILGQSSDSSLFADDPYLMQNQAKLILCLPILHRERLAGVWYAESDSGNGLREGSMALLRMLSSQAGSALENASLYERLKVTTVDLAGANRRLESEVGLRTAELRESNERLLESNERLLEELDERARIERERASLQERIILMQEETLIELSTPLIPISDRVAVMPLIGAMDEKRAERLVEAALTGVHERGLRVLIVDVTGLREIGVKTAGTLPRMAAALGLIGAKVVLTGVRADTAKTLVAMNLDMTAITLKRTLQAGIAFAAGSAVLRGDS